MRLSLKIGASAAVVASGLGALDHFLHWMNRASDLWLYIGLLGTIGVAVAMTELLSTIWTSRGRGL